MSSFLNNSGRGSNEDLSRGKWVRRTLFFFSSPPSFFFFFFLKEKRKKGGEGWEKERESHYPTNFVPRALLKTMN